MDNHGINNVNIYTDMRLAGENLLFSPVDASSGRIFLSAREIPY